MILLRTEVSAASECIELMTSRSGAGDLWHRSSHKNEQFLSVSGNQIRYVGPGTEDKDAASVRTRLPARDAFHYFEVEVVNNGQLGFIGTLVLCLTNTSKLDKCRPGCCLQALASPRQISRCASCQAGHNTRMAITETMARCGLSSVGLS